MYKSRVSKSNESVIGMTLLECKFICSGALEEVHISSAASLPEDRAFFSVASVLPDAGTVFTVYSYGVSDFVFKNTCNLTLTINTVFTPVNAFLNSAPESAARHVPHKHDFKHERKQMQSRAFCGHRMALRL